MFGGAAIAGYFVLLFASIAVWWAIGSATGLDWSAVIVAVLWASSARSSRWPAAHRWNRSEAYPRQRTP
jgi:hypothetical protein